MHRTSKDLKKTLVGGRRIAFVGDSITRNTFFSFANLAGGKLPQSFDKHSNIEIGVGQLKVRVGSADVSPCIQLFLNVLALRSLRSSQLNFFWAPYVSDLKSTITRADTFFDTFIVGNGLWDCLHKHDELNDKSTGYKDTLGELVSLLSTNKRSHGTGVMWLMPTTVNDANLQIEEKIEFMKEEQVAVYRNYQRFILSDEPSFDLIFDMSLISASRVSESYDGVHYPTQIYDVSAQIISQALDWSLPDRELEDVPFVPNEPGKMANPSLGLLMVLISLIGLFTFDGYLGFGWLPSLLFGGPNCQLLWEEAFAELHSKIGVSLPSHHQELELTGRTQEEIEEKSKLIG